MATPGDNTEVIRMLKDVKNSLWRSVTPMRATETNFNDYISGLSRTVTSNSHINEPNIATRLNFSSLDDTQVAESSMLRTFQSPESLKRKLMNTEAELQASKAKVKERESMISVMEPANKKLRMSLENKLEKYRQQNELDAQKIEELQAKLKWAKKQMSSAKSQINEIERQKKIELDQQELRLLALQQENSNLKVEIADVKSEKTEAIRKLHMEIGSLELKVSMLSEETQKSQEYIQSLKKKNSEMAEAVALCNSYKEELKEAQIKINALENKIEANKDAALIIASRQNDLKSLTELQKENRILKEEVAKYKSPTAFSRKLSQYQQNEAVLTNKLSHLTSHCETLEKQMRDKDEIIKSFNYNLEQAQLNTSRMESVVKRFQRKILFLSKEKDNCRKLLDSYLSEATISGVALNAAQISHLEEMNAEYKKALEKCEMEIDTLNEKLKNYAGFKAGESSLEENKLKEENAALLSKISNFQKEIQELKNKLSKQESDKGSSSGSGEKILHLRFNPLDTANQRYLERFNKLQEENDQLKKRIKVLEEEGVAATDVTMKVQQKLRSEGADSTLESLKEQLAAAERKTRFILENARLKSTEFREAVYQLLGYRIDVPMAETYKLSHVYADSRDDYLLFKINSEGIQLVETEYSKQVSDKMETYLHQHDSFPAFLASLTMDLFNQQTFMISQ
ncbi:unnamed protein product [Larinioides sclopetarius]|uniref:Mitotic spindle assembly checkpoint protein MAD1 n=1 Tax=Larinioides sclopetarius TaxID=280406 RepID=A0AAV2AV89_9ARAC